MTDLLDKSIDDLVALIGVRVRERRREIGLSRRELSEKSDVSQRYLAQVESGQGNVSIALLSRIGTALDRPVAWFVGDTDVPADAAEIVTGYRRAGPETQAAVRRLLGVSAPSARGRRVALIGLRGAGKSTLGRRVSEALDRPFVELNDQIEAAAGMTVADIMALYGQEGYRRLEQQGLSRVIEDHDTVILAVAGGIVVDEATYRHLRDRFHTIWLRASADEHMARVRAQGDERPMAGNPAAMDDLRSILRERERLYAQADATLDTSGQTEDASAESLLKIVAGMTGAAAMENG